MSNHLTWKMDQKVSREVEKRSNELREQFQRAEATIREKYC